MAGVECARGADWWRDLAAMARLYGLFGIFLVGRTLSPCVLLLHFSRMIHIPRAGCVYFEYPVRRSLTCRGFMPLRWHARITQL